jgi:hypothetical protein
MFLNQEGLYNLIHKHEVDYLFILKVIKYIIYLSTKFISKYQEFLM